MLTTPRDEIATATQESIHDYGFDVLIVNSSGASQSLKTNGRKQIEDISPDGLPIVSNKPVLTISKKDLSIDIKKGDKVKTPTDWFYPGALSTWWSIENVRRSSDDWFIKIYLTKTEQI